MSDHYYRIYDLDHRGSIVRACNRSFADDAEALAHADELLADRPGVEVWQTDRLVGRREQQQFLGFTGAGEVHTLIRKCGHLFEAGALRFPRAVVCPRGRVLLAAFGRYFPKHHDLLGVAIG